MSIDPKKIAQAAEIVEAGEYAGEGYWRETVRALLSERGDFIRDLADRQALLDMLSAIRAALQPDPNDGRSTEAIARAVRADREEMLALLRRCEWAGEDDGSRDRCPLCNGRRDEGHRPACDLAAFLKET